MISAGSLVDLISVALVVPAVGLAAVVVKHWAPKALRALMKKTTASGEEWLILGVTLGFSAFIFNSLFWGAHFLADFMGWDGLRDLTYRLVPAANIVTRNVPYAIAALCHLIAYNQYRSDAPKSVWYAGWATLLFIGVALLLFFAGPENTARVYE